MIRWKIVLFAMVNYRPCDTRDDRMFDDASRSDFEPVILEDI
jgi:hypothetical protein